MPDARTPRPAVLDRPPKLSETLKEDRPEDCTPCRIMGATAFGGLGAYTYVSGHSQLKAQEAKIVQSKSLLGMRSRRIGITGMAISLMGVGLWRLVN